MRRILTAAALIPVAAYAVLWAGPWVFRAILAAVACLCYREYDAISAGFGFGVFPTSSVSTSQAGAVAIGVSAGVSQA